MAKLVRFIYINTLMDKFTLAFLKILFIIVPLCLGLFTYNYMCVDFCKSLFLYAAALSFDMGIKCGKIGETKENGIFLYIIVALIFTVSVVLTGIAFVGIINNEWLISFDIFTNIQQYVYAGILLQAFWYAIESVFLFWGELIKKTLKKTPINVSQDSDWKYNI